MGKLKERQIIAKYYGCKADLMDSEGFRNTVIKAVEVSNMHLLGDPHVYRVDDDIYGGISILALIVESHIALHTWPKFKHAWVDIATCGKGVPEKGLKVISNFLNADEEKIQYDSSQELGEAKKKSSLFHNSLPRRQTAISQ